jgi:ATP:ADP antiporter, AAA family
MITRLLKALYGDFTKDELRKFLFLGVIFAFVIGVYWTLRPLKDSIFMSMVHSDYIGRAKIISVFLLLPLVMVYTKLLEKFPRYHMFYLLGGIYSLATIGFGLLFMHPTIGISNTTVDATRWIAWLWYVFVESYGSLMVALFWSFATDTSTEDAARRGFALVVMIGQLGSILGPLVLGPLGKTYFSNSAPVVIICGFLIIFITALVYFFMKTTPREQLVGFHGKNEQQAEKEQEPGFLEGLKLMLSKPYLLGIFGIIAFYEIIITIVDFHFKGMVFTNFADEASRAFYLKDYAVWVNVVSFLCLLFGISNIQRRLGLTVSLGMMPIIVAGIMILFKTYPNISMLFYIMVAAKAINYALNGPSQKQLYVPTTRDVKYKAQAWIETFGSRGAKATSGAYNDMLKSFKGWFGPDAGLAWHIALGSYLSFGLVAVWFFVALYLAKTHRKAVEQNKVVC